MILVLSPVSIVCINLVKAVLRRETECLLMEDQEEWAQSAFKLQRHVELTWLQLAVTRVSTSYITSLSFFSVLDLDFVRELGADEVSKCILLQQALIFQ